MGKIVVFGDSIAYGKWDEQGGWVARLRDHIDHLCNFGKPGNVQVYNMGIPGELAVRMVKRVPEELRMRIDLADTKGNNVVIFAAGINDSNPANWITLKQSDETEFKHSISTMIREAKNQGAKVACIGLTPINEQRFLPASKFKGAFFQKHVAKFEKYLEQICKDEHTPFLSCYNDLLNSDFIDTIIDGVHPNTKGHEMMYAKILSFLQEEGLIDYVK